MVRVIIFWGHKSAKTIITQWINELQKAVKWVKILKLAEVAELADALRSGRSLRKEVEVQILSSAQILIYFLTFLECSFNHLEICSTVKLPLSISTANSISS